MRDLVVSETEGVGQLVDRSGVGDAAVGSEQYLVARRTRGDATGGRFRRNCLSRTGMMGRVCIDKDRADNVSSAC